VIVPIASIDAQPSGYARAAAIAEKRGRTMSRFRPGQRLTSAVCEAQVVVVRAPAEDVEIGCGGAAMLDVGAEPPAGCALDATLGDAPLLGKRYADEEAGLELLCTRAGKGALTVDGRVLPVKGAKPLPSSD
jgi:hypothetical protein